MLCLIKRAHNFRDFLASLLLLVLPNLHPRLLLMGVLPGLTNLQRLFILGVLLLFRAKDLLRVVFMQLVLHGTQLLVPLSDLALPHCDSGISVFSCLFALLRLNRVGKRLFSLLGRGLSLGKHARVFIVPSLLLSHVLGKPFFIGGICALNISSSLAPDLVPIVSVLLHAIFRQFQVKLSYFLILAPKCLHLGLERPVPP
mmetsp:Transcript_39442/g.61489  ORF Transcript_39442/g.61489 Transcript_39442/m.61489 type:complete len:200 (+) Transcript_39442:445-1044(+)